MLDYLYIRAEKYLLVLVDGHSRKMHLKVALRANVEIVLEILLEFRANYGFAETFLVATDNGSHFANILHKELQAKLR